MACRYTFDFLTNGDLPALTDLWQQCFRETEEDALFFLQNSFRPGETLLLRYDGRPVSMMTLIPARLQNTEGAYIYAVATHPEYQGRGLMRLLHDEALRCLKTQGVQFTCLVPASVSLFGLYEKLGYVPRFFRSRREYSEISPCQILDFHTPSVVELASLRADYLSRLPYSLRLLCPDYLYQELRHYGGGAVSFQTDGATGYAAYTRNGCVLYVRECSVPFTQPLGSSLLHYTECRRIVLDLPGTDTPVGMYRPLDPTRDPFPADFTGHLSLCLDQ